MAEAEDALEGARQEATRLRGRLSTAQQSLKVRDWTYSARQGRPVETAWCQHDQCGAVARGALPVARHEPPWGAACCRLRGDLAILLEFQSKLSATRRSPLVTGIICGCHAWTCSLTFNPCKQELEGGLKVELAGTQRALEARTAELRDASAAAQKLPGVQTRARELQSQVCTAALCSRHNIRGPRKC